MTGYMPATEQVREEWQYGHQDVDMDGNVTVSFDAAGKRFDRWLASVKADVWDEAYQAGAFDALGPPWGAQPNPYRTGAEA